MTSANLKALSLLETASKVMGDMKDEIANLKERNNMMVKQLGDYYNCLDKDELDGLAMLEGSPLEHSDYIRYLNDVMRNYAFMDYEFSVEKEGLVAENTKLNDENISLKQKVGEFIAISDKITNENFGLQKDYCEQNKEIKKLKEDLKESDANFKEEREEKRVLQKANIGCRCSGLKEENKVMEDARGRCLSELLATERNSAKCYINELKEEIAHKNEKFCEWIEENKELKEFNKILREEYLELYELLNCEDHSAAKCCINKLKERNDFLEEKVINILTNDSYLECCGLEKAKEDELKAHIEGAKKYSYVDTDGKIVVEKKEGCSYDITSLYPTGVIYANGSSSEMDNGIETLADDEDIVLAAKEYK